MYNYLKQYFKDQLLDIEALPKAGSDRKYFRVKTTEQNFIACENYNVEENKAFFYYTKFFTKQGIPVPQLIDVSEDQCKYIQTDVGHLSLLETLQSEGYTEEVKELYKKSLKALVDMQISGKSLEATMGYGKQSFDRQTVLADLHYFKYYFLDLHKIIYNKYDLNVEFEKMAAQIGNQVETYFMFRDFQGRNILIQDEQPHFIDYQGGMPGPLQYDIASLLWQAKANLPHEWKQELYAYYLHALQQKIRVDEKEFESTYSRIVLIRLLQVLGAYGLRGMIEKRTHFLTSIPAALKNITSWLSQYELVDYPVLHSVLQSLVTQIPMDKYQFPQANEQTKLKVLIQSFSFKKGLPDDESGNGGGFIFDCRGILNPGRFDEYKKLTDRDQPVIDFLESKTKINEFLSHAKQCVDISIEDYLQRDFENLLISFGCTGGQHRSVYCADAMAKHLKEKYKLNIQVQHIIQDAKNWVN
ncbi:MAG: phosphotransferase [Bacteroidetes bacterium]|nr:phosphotransferase [Bacteroidota bacterium]